MQKVAFCARVYYIISIRLLFYITLFSSSALNFRFLSFADMVASEYAHNVK